MDVSQKTKNRTIIWPWVYIQENPKPPVQKNTCTPVFIATLFTVAKIWKQPKCPSTDEWIKKMWYIYTMEYYSVIQKEWNFASCSNMDGLGGYFANWNKSDRERQILYDIIYMWNLKIYHTNEYDKKEADSQIQRTN